MAVPIEKQEDLEPPYERCCFCRNRTTFWTNLPDRTHGQQVACCPGCACSYKPKEVPTKDAWFEKEMALEPRRAGS